MSKKTKQDGDNGDCSSSLRDPVEITYPTEDDVLHLIHQRLDQGHFCGVYAGRKLCIANLGWAFDADQLRRELQQHLSGVVSFCFAGTVIEAKSLHSGHGCIEFDSVENAIKGSLALDHLYIDVPGLPLPRPILSYFPMFEGPLWGDDDIPGYRQHRVAPHFCQVNTLEWDAALEWRHLHQYLSLSKKRLCDVFIKRLCREFALCKQDIDTEMMKSAFKKEAEEKPPRTVVCTGTSITVKNEQVRNAVEMAEHCGHIRRLMCPVTNTPTGTLFIELSSSEQAASFVEDVNKFQFILNIAPRPLHGELVKFGPARGFEGIYDRAVESVFDVKLCQLDRSQFGNAHVVDVRAWKKEKREPLEKIRLLMDDMMMRRMCWKLESYEHQKDLHNRHMEWIDRELKKLDKLELLDSRLRDEGLEGEK